ncbi:hypothetical protein [Nitrospira moscoviensis]|uniref:hypothetical protein n=1 Tax=Nitrospira moscoviensis TaxID=42253 RepID=UPI0006A7B459|nr:hypothetical protein [Nitrospira moscoviensis]
MPPDRSRPFLRAAAGLAPALLLGAISCAFAVPLWSPTGSPAEPDAKGRQPWLLREQTIRFNQQALEALRDLTRPVEPALEITLMDGTSRTLAIRSRTAGPLDSTVVTATLPDVPDSELTLVIKGQAVAGTLHIGRRLFKIQYAGDHRHRLAEVDADTLPPD